jgi:hypothetical protein
MPGFSDDMTLGEARALLRTLVDDGAACPCCTQFAKVYRRKIHSRMARDLITFYRQHGREWGHSTETLGASAPDFVKLVYWGIVETDDLGLREDGSKRTGWWRITSDGVEFLFDRARTPKYARVYDGRCLGLTGDPIGIRDALGNRFFYRDLMDGV